jgi:vitamin B12 transporter
VETCIASCRLVVVGIVLALFVGHELSRAEDTPEITTREVITSATKTPLPASQVTSAVEVITGQELEQKKIKTVFDALRLAQGVTAFSSGGPGSLANIRIRGAQSKHTLVVIDGTIVNSPTDGAFNFANLTAENIENIEILRGAQSMLWGSDAIGGVINITTKRGTGKPTASAFVEYGSFATIREGGQLSGTKGPFDFSLSLSRWDTSNFSAVSYERGAAERDGFHNWQASGKLGYRLPKDGRIEVNLRWWNSDVNRDSAFGTTRFDVFGAKSTTRTLILSGSYEQPITNWWSQKLTLAQNNERQLDFSGTSQKNLATGAVTVPFPFSSDLEILNRRIEWQHNFQVGKPLLLTAGYQFREEQGDASGFYGGSQPNRLLSSNSGFAQAQLNIEDRLLMTAGVRQDSYNVFGDATTYRVTGGYLFRETGTKVRASYATGFRTPTLNDLFFQGANNPDLKPEKSRSLDVGVEQRLFKGRLQLNAGYFWNRFRDLIQFVSSPTCPPATFGTCPVNIANSKSQGWEFGFQYAVLSNLDIRGQYTLTLTRDFPVTGANRRLARWPVDQASVSLHYRPIEAARINVDYRFVGSRNDDAANTPALRSGSFGVVNMSATYDATKNVQVFGRIDNLFNQGYEEILSFGTPIRSVYGGVKLTY